jgi:thiol-disulfide isomerase/thioredoxin
VKGFLLGILTLGVVGAIVYVMTASQPPATVTPTPQASTGMSPAAVGAYVEYRAGIIEATKGTKVLFFHAPWCPQCRKLEQNILDGSIPSGVTIVKVDYDSNQALRQKYGVTIQTTLVRVNDAGMFEKKYIAYESPTLDAVKANLLQEP